jgi:putative membrane protein
LTGAPFLPLAFFAIISSRRERHRLDCVLRTDIGIARPFAAVLLAAVSGPVLAHEGVGDSWWSLDPFVIAGFGLLVFLRPRVVWSFALGVAALFLALIWPLDALSEHSLAAHMAQHMLLIAAAAPLLVHSRPVVRSLARLPRVLLHLAALRPRTTFLVHAIAIWVGHAPLVIEWTVQYRWFHVLGHIALLGTALLFCHSLMRRDRYGEAALWMAATMIHTGALGALLTFASRVLYPGYSHVDQQLAGLIMWVPGGLCYLAVGLGYASAWLRSAERGSTRPATHTAARSAE